MTLQRPKSTKIAGTLAGGIASLIFSAALFSLPSKATAVVTVGVSNASVVEVATGGALTVYGGVAGSTLRCEGGISTTAPCNNCTLKDTDPQGAGDALLLACNERRIHESLLLTITVVSDAIDGRPSITTSDGTVQLAFSGPTGILPKGTVSTLTLPWSTVCTKIIAADAQSGGAGATACVPSLGNAASTLRVGVSTAASNGLLNGAGDDQKSVSFIIRNVAGNTAATVPSLADNCDSSSLDSRICYFEVGPGDEKAVVRTLVAPDGSSFPSAETTQFRAVRFLWAEGDFANINLASAHQDLVLTGSDVATFNVTPRRIEGLTNDKTYYFKNALVDAAGNVGLYSAAGPTGDGDCSKSPTPTANDCRIVTPSEVVGVLDKTNCFIATAAYGTSFASELDTLRDFRDQILSRSESGNRFIRWYYANSPHYAKMILEHPAARATVRAALVPVVWFAGLALAYGPANAALAFLAALVVLAALINLARRHAVQNASPSATEGQEARKDSRTSLLPVIFAAFVIPAVASTAGLPTADAAPTQQRKPAADEIMPLEELRTDDETPPEPEYPYPGAKGTTPTTSTTSSAAKKKTRTEPLEDTYPADLLDMPTDYGTTPPADETSTSQSLDAPTDRVEPEPPEPTPAPRVRRKAPVASSQDAATRPRYTGTKPRDPKKSLYAKPQTVNEDGDYIFEKLPDRAARQYPPPKRHKFSKQAGREAPASISLDGAFNYPVKESGFSGAAGVRFGFMSPPNITNASNGLTFKEIYGKEQVAALLFEYEYPLTRAIGRIGIKFETGAYAKQAAGRFKNPSRLAELPEEKFTFVMIPLQAALHYRFQFADAQFLVPFVEGGAAYNGIVELRDDNKTPRFGGAPALIAGGGVNILLDWIDKRSIRQLDAEYGINHVWFTAQFRQTVGLKKDLDITSNMISAGFTFDY